MDTSPILAHVHPPPRWNSFPLTHSKTSYVFFTVLRRLSFCFSPMLNDTFGCFSSFLIFSDHGPRLLLRFYEAIVPAFGGKTTKYYLIGGNETLAASDESEIQRARARLHHSQLLPLHAALMTRERNKDACAKNFCWSLEEQYIPNIGFGFNKEKLNGKCVTEGKIFKYLDYCWVIVGSCFTHIDGVTVTFYRTLLRLEKL